MILQIIFSLLVVGLLGLMFGVGLSYAARRLKVEKDQRLQEMEDILPGINCGACGYAGCSGYAEYLINEDEPDLEKCSPGGPEVLSAIGDYLGVEVSGNGEKLVAYVHCQGTKDKAKESYNYQGLDDCNAMNIYFGGEKQCKHGCHGSGSCIKVCPVDCISKESNGLVVVDREKCIGCGKCVDVCPTGVIKMIPYSADYAVACNSTDKGVLVKNYCSVGCIGCKICDRQSPDGGYVIDNFLAAIDYAKGGERGKGAEKCPVKCIASLEKK